MINPSLHDTLDNMIEWYRMVTFRTELRVQTRLAKSSSSNGRKLHALFLSRSHRSPDMDAAFSGVGFGFGF